MWDTLLPSLTAVYLEYVSSTGPSENVPSSANPSQQRPDGPQTPINASSRGTTPMDTTGDANVRNESSATSAAPEAIPYMLRVFNLFNRQSMLTISRPQDSISPALDLLKYGYIARTPLQPGYAVSVETLLLLHRLRQHKPSLSIEAYAKVISEYYSVRFILFPVGPCLKIVYLNVDSLPALHARHHRRHVRNLPAHPSRCRRSCEQGPREREPQLAYSEFMSGVLL